MTFNCRVGQGGEVTKPQRVIFRVQFPMDICVYLNSWKKLVKAINDGPQTLGNTRSSPFAHFQQ